MRIINAARNLRLFLKTPIAFMADIHKTHGDFFSLYLGHKKFHFAFHPDHAQHFLLSNADRYKKSRLIFNKIKPITGENGLVQLEDDAWTEMRKRTSESFQNKYFDEYLTIINEYADQTVFEIEKYCDMKQQFDISNIMINYTMKTAVRILFGMDLHQSRLANHFIELNYLCGLKMKKIISSPYFIPTPINLKILKIQKNIKSEIDFLIKNSMAQKNQCLLSHLAKHYSKLPNNKNIIRDQLMTFLFAGYETTAASLTFCLYLLAEHPAYQDNILNESHTVNTYQLNQIKSAAMTAAIYRESLRLYPPAWILAREATKHDAYANQKINRGDNLILSIYQIHRHNDFWVNANDFIPERFMKNDETIKKNKFAFIPFGYGKRICSGMQLAMLEATVVLLKIFKSIRLHPILNGNLKLDAMVTLHPQGKVMLYGEKIIR